MQLEIRPAVEDDIAAIFAIRTDVTENHLSLEQLAELGITPETIKEVISASPGTWVASVDGQICGFSMADTEPGGVFALFVKRGWEGRGVGTRLMEPVETLLLPGMKRSGFRQNEIAAQAVSTVITVGWL